MPKTQAKINIDMLFYLNNAYNVIFHFPIDLYALSSLIEVCVLFNTKLCSTHAKCDRLLYFLVCVWKTSYSMRESLYIQPRTKLEWFS